MGKIAFLYTDGSINWKKFEEQYLYLSKFEMCKSFVQIISVPRFYPTDAFEKVCQDIYTRTFIIALFVEPKMA